MSGIKVDLKMIRKYNIPGPRYTSYPPATHFTDEVLPEPLLGELDASKAKVAPLSLYFHLPFCHSQCLYCGCTNIVTGNQKRSREYLDYIRRELDLRAATIHPDSQVQQIQLGGGTPTFLLPEELEELGQMIRERFTVADDVEAGVEIDPRYLNEAKIKALKAAGFNRGSLGVQDTNPDVQKIINRIQPREQNEQATQWLRENDFKSVNFDLIYGLPGQTVESFEATIDEVLSLNPDRFAVYSYAHIPWIKPFQKTYDELLPKAETKLK